VASVRRVLAVLVAVVALVAAPAAVADTFTAKDAQGRTITFDVRAQDVAVEWYANLLRNAAHGDEIERVTIRVVTADELRDTCGSGAAACYGGSRTAARIVVPAGESAQIAHSLVHEYGHHVDAWRGVGAASREPNGSAQWWAARGISQLLADGRVSHTYSLGWDHAIGELFAEDYAQLHLQTPWRISWLEPPGEPVLAALRTDLDNAPTEAVPATTRPLVITRRGTLRPRGTHTIPFGLLGPGRRVTFTATLGRPGTARLELRCGDGRTATRAVRTRTATIDLRNLGPATCRITLRSTVRRAVSFAARLRLAVEPV
jgi:hypothetical protein